MSERFHELIVPTRVLFQPGGVGIAGRECRKIGVRRAFVVTDRLLRELGLLAPLEESLQREGVAVAAIFDDVPADSDIPTVERAAALRASTSADGIIALGGGSVIDTAKAVNILAAMGGALREHQGVGNLDDAPLLPFLCLPTTAGTGSEVSYIAAVKDHAKREKIFFVSPKLAATVAILDPMLTLSMPPKVTAITGMDALTHAIESLFAINAQPATEGLALSAIRRILRHLPTAVHSGRDLEARSELLLASNIAGIAFSNSGVGIVHACAHALGALKGIAHGLGNSLLLPSGSRYNLDSLPLERRDLLTLAFGTPEIPRRLREFAAECGLPIRLRDVGIREADLPDLATYAETDGSLLFNPREASSLELLELFKEAW